MIVTWRFASLLLIAAVLLAFSGFGLAPAAIAWNALLLLAAAVDFARAPRPKNLSLARECPDELSLGAPNLVRLHLRSDSPRPLSAVVRDEPPADFAVEAYRFPVRVAPFGEAEVSYHVTPSHKGDHRFGRLHLRYRSPWGLLFRQWSVSAEKSVKVYPNLQEVRRYELLARRGRLREVGIRASRFRGAGTEFESLRDYQPDDEFRRIDWKATARRGRPITSLYQTERSQQVMLILDAGRLMAGQVGQVSKLDHAINAALLLAYVATAMGDQVGLLAFAGSMRAYQPPARGRSQVFRLLEHLYRLEPELVEPDYREAFRFLAGRQRRRSLLIVFTDLVDRASSEILLRQLIGLRGTHLVLCVLLADADLVALARARPETTDDAFRTAVAQQVLLDRQAAISQLREEGVHMIEVPAAELSVNVINQYLRLKGRSLL